MTVLAVIQQ